MRSKSKFSREQDQIIKDFMVNNKCVKHPFSILSKMESIPFDTKQIASRWWSKLDPRLCKDAFSQEEKDFIYNWVPEHTQPEQNIQWKDLQAEMKAKLGNFRARNSLKNIWNSKQKQIKAKSKVNSIPLNDARESDEENFDELCRDYKIDIEADDNIDVIEAEAGASNKASIDYMLNKINSTSILMLFLVNDSK
ncbi:8565_t:CDS:2 [Funneliformis caledonium]|uniref:8565_t:CDS:1 n=1 Tax=Funneliformis caledonium TaxID=1117310 RepID=A0A9N9ESH2_9GLOM|nr:8565_t:CDS:2 [Funneliformis caledonium]